MRDAGHRTPDIGHRTTDIGHRTAKKAKIIYPPPRGVDIIKNVRYIWRDKNILKIGMATLQRYPAGPKFC